MTHDTARHTDTNPTPKTKLLLGDDDPLIVESVGQAARLLGVNRTTLYS